MLCCEVMSDFEDPYFNSDFIVLERRLLLVTMSLWEQIIFTSCHCISLLAYKWSFLCLNPFLYQGNKRRKKGKIGRGSIDNKVFLYSFFRWHLFQCWTNPFYLYGHYAIKQTDLAALQWLTVQYLKEIKRYILFIVQLWSDKIYQVV